MTSSSSLRYYGALLLATAVTPVHAGAGRGYGVVDLPIQRDALGYPEIWASSIKGALKSHLLKIFDNDTNARNAVLGFFGSEPEETPTVPGLAMLHNLVPLAIPIPSATHGFLYVATPYLLARVKTYIDILKEVNPPGIGANLTLVFRGIEALVNALLTSTSELTRESVATLNRNLGTPVVLGPTRFDNIKTVEVDEEKRRLVHELDKYLSSMFPLFSVKKLSDAIVVVEDNVGRHIIEAAIQRVYRVRLSRYTKTVEHGALWSEEYLPYGTVLVGLLMYQDVDQVLSRTRDEKASQYYASLKQYITTILGNIHEKYIVVGGKETIGKGILRLALVSPMRLSQGART